MDELRTQQVSVQRPDIPASEAFLVTLAAGLGYFFDAYAVNIYGFVLPLIAVSYHASLAAMGIIGSILLLGYTLGTMGFGMAADRFGRKDTLGVSIILYGVTTALGGIAPNLALFTGSRFLTGLGGAGELAVGAPYSSEMWTPRMRSWGTGGIIFALYSLGAMLALLVTILLVPHFGWRMAFVVAVIPAFLIYILRRRLSESIRFLEARAEQAKHKAQEHIWSVPGAKRRVLVGALIFIANAVGYWGLTVFTTTYLIKTFKVTHAFAWDMGLVFFASMFLFSWVGPLMAEAVGRRWAGVLGAVAIGAVTVGAYFTHSLALFVVLEALSLGMLGYTWAVGNTYVSEIFPTRFRGTGFGLSVGIGRVASIVAPTIIGLSMVSFGIQIAIVFISLLFVLQIIGYLLGPETRGKELEELEAF